MTDGADGKSTVACLFGEPGHGSGPAYDGNRLLEGSTQLANTDLDLEAGVAQGSTGL